VDIIGLSVARQVIFAGSSGAMLSKLNNVPTVPLVIGAVVTFMGCLLIAGLGYALFAPAKPGVAQSRPPTATRPFVTATPISTVTPTPTDTATPTPTGLPTATPTHTPIPSTRVPSTRVPTVTPTITPIPPTPVPGADLGLDFIKFKVPITVQGSGLTLPYTFSVHNANAWQVPYGIIGAAAHDADGNTVRLQRSHVNSYLDVLQTLKMDDAIKIYVTGQFDLYLVICLSANDAACSLPGADWRMLAGPIHITIT
jgi:hypothetical protein